MNGNKYNDRKSQIDIVAQDTIHNDMSLKILKIQIYYVSFVWKTYIYKDKYIVNVNDCKFKKIRIVCDNSDCYIILQWLPWYLCFVTKNKKKLCTI